MKRSAAALVLVAALGGCMSPEREPGGPSSMGGCAGCYGAVRPPPVVPGMQTAYGQPLPMAQPYATTPPASAALAYQMMSQNVPLDLMQASQPGMPPMAPPSNVVQASANCGPGGCMPGVPTPPGGLIAPPGAPFGPGMPGHGPMLPPSSAMLPVPLPPGAGPMMPTSGGTFLPAGCGAPPGAVAAAGALTGGPPSQFPAKRTQVRFVRPSGMKVAWVVPGPNGGPVYSPTALEAPGRYNFLQASIYRLKLSNIEGRPGLEVYPTLEVVPSNCKTEAFLAHSAVPIEFSNEDFDQIAAGNYVVKVIYLPDPQFQEVAATGIEEISSTRLEPGADPIVEALRRGSILLVIRMGNMDQEAPNTPAIDAPAPGCGVAQVPPGMMAGPGPLPPFAMGAPGAPMMPPGAMMGPAGVGMMGPYGPMGNGPGIPPGLRMNGSGPATSQAPAATGPISANTPPSVPPVWQAAASTPPAPVLPPPVVGPPSVPTQAELAAQYNGPPR
jgi:hypothetical protein